MKKAFTFAELMISLVVIAIITAILYPTIADLAPNNNEQLFRNTYKSLELIIADIVGSSADGTVPTSCVNDATPEQEVACASDNKLKLCKEFASRLNTVNHQDADGNEQTDCVGNVIQTANGVKWFFKLNGNTIDIYTDVNMSNNTSNALQKTKTEDKTDSKAKKVCVNVVNSNNCPGINDAYCTDLDDAFGFGYSATNNPTSQDTFKMNVSADGKIKTIDCVATQHLRNKSTSVSSASTK